MEFKEEYSNAADVKVENIPPNVLDDLAVLFYNVFARMEDEQKNKETA